MANVRIKKGDIAVVISGKDKGREAKVLSVYPKEERILAENINMKKIHQKPKKSGEKGSIIQVHTPIYAAKALPKCPHCGKAVRVGFSEAGSEKRRICKKCKAEF